MEEDKNGFPIGVGNDVRGRRKFAGDKPSDVPGNLRKRPVIDNASILRTIKFQSLMEDLNMATGKRKSTKKLRWRSKKANHGKKPVSGR